MSDDGLSGEKKRLEQYLLQSKASKPQVGFANIIMVDPRYSRFKPEKIDTIRLRAAQIQAGKQPVSEKLIKEQLKKKKKAKTKKQLRGEVGRAILEQKRFEKGERRDKPEQEPRIIREPINTGLSYDPDIERRKLDIQEQLNRDANLRALMDRRAAQNRLEQELAVRRGELAAGRAERRAERERLAGLPAPTPIVIPPAAAPVINIPAAQQATTDPTPEIQRLSALIRRDVNAFGAEQRAVNQDVFSQVRRQAQRQGELERRQVVIDEEQRQLRLAQDANLQEIQSRLGMTEHSIGRARDVVIQEIRDSENRLRTARGELEIPINFDDVILREANRRIDEERPPRASRTSVREPGRGDIVATTRSEPERREPEPEEPTGIEGIIEGGGLLELPNIVIERPGNIGFDESLRLTPRARTHTRGTAGPEQEAELSQLSQGRTSLSQGRTSLSSADLGLTSEASSLGIPAERLAREGGRGTGQYSSEPSEISSEELQFRLEPHDPIDVASVLRLSRLAEQGLRVEEAEEQQAEGGQAEGGQRQAEGGQRQGQSELPRPGQVAERVQAIETIEAGNRRPVASERVIEDAGIQAQPSVSQRRPSVSQRRPSVSQVEGLGEVEEVEEEGVIEDQRAQRIRDSQTIYRESIADLSSQVRQGPRGARGERGGLGYRVRNNTDKPLKRVKPGDVVNIIGVEQGVSGGGRYRLDTETQAGTRVGLDQLSPLINSGAFLFEKGHRHELGGHFDREAYGPPEETFLREPPLEDPQLQEEGGE